MDQKKRFTGQQYENYSLVVNLKKKIEQLNATIQDQARVIEEYKRSTKTTLINEQEVYIQKLNDENKRLLLLIEDLKDPKRCYLASQKLNRKYGLGSSTKKSEKEVDKPRPEDKAIEQKPLVSEEKYYEIIQENNNLRKELSRLRANENNSIKKKKCFNDRSSILIEKNLGEAERAKQRTYELEVEAMDLKNKNDSMKARVTELEDLLEKALRINKSMKIIS